MNAQVIPVSRTVYVESAIHIRERCVMGDIGEPVRRIEFEPLPDEAPVEEPAIAPAQPAPAKEPVPA